ncbi:hypothetical protein HPB52_001398 [Rhipicephalus sanguineus]|uniref:Uncharacterized protein n=1 Tax=Rhipicephalus sanguineus TaxID=34632 RepID=A0A9D4QBM4_RHISA|nr:hypothetical protein HPB52_001398 [Rhipicephalus sanguineus]
MRTQMVQERRLGPQNPWWDKEVEVAWKQRRQANREHRRTVEGPNTEMVQERRLGPQNPWWDKEVEVAWKQRRQANREHRRTVEGPNTETVLLSRVDSQAGTGAEDGDHNAQDERERISGVQSGCLSRGNTAHSDEEGDEEGAESAFDSHVYLQLACALTSWQVACKCVKRRDERKVKTRVER